MINNFPLIKKVYIPLLFLAFFLFVSNLCLSSASNLLFAIYNSPSVIPLLKAYQVVPEIGLIIFLLVYSYKKPFSKVFSTTLVILGTLISLSALLLFFQESLHWIPSYKINNIENLSLALVEHLPATIFILLAKLFNANLIYIFIWGFINQIMIPEEGRRMYIPFAFVLGVLYGVMTVIQPILFRFGVFPLTLLAIFFFVTAIISFQRLYARLPEERLLAIVAKSHEKAKFPFSSAGYFLAACLMIAYFVNFVFKSQVKLQFPNPNDYVQMMGNFSIILGFTSLAFSIIWMIVGLYLLKKRGLSKTFSIVTYTTVIVAALYIIYAVVFSSWIGLSLFISFFRASHAAIYYPLIQILYLYLPVGVRFSKKIIVEMILFSLWRLSANVSLMISLTSVSSVSFLIYITLSLIGIILLGLLYAYKRLKSFRGTSLT